MSAYSQWATLAITDGSRTGTANLLSETIGLGLAEWKPKIIQPKSGGTYQESSLAPMKRLVSAVDDTATETIIFNISHYNQDRLFELVQNFVRLLFKARDYWLTEWQDEPVYLKARSQRETNERYALIHNFGFSELGDLYGPSFFDIAAKIVTLDRLTVTIERGHWLGNAPGSSTCIQASNQQSWDYASVWAQVGGAVGGASGAYSIIQVTGGDMYAACPQTGGAVIKSTDNGDTWISIFTAAGVSCYTLLELQNGYILVGNSSSTSEGVYRTTNSGSSWSNVSIAGMDAVLGLAQTSGGTVLASGGDIWRSTDNGANWTLVQDGYADPFQCIAISNSGNIVAGTTGGGLFVSTNDGATWTQVVIMDASITNIHLISDGNLYLCTNPGTVGSAKIYRSEDEGYSWSPIYTALYSGIGQLLETATDGTFYAGMIYYGWDGASRDTRIFKSTDYGISWAVDYNGVGVVKMINIAAILQASDGQIYIVLSDTGLTENQMWRRSSGNPLTLGKSPTCTDNIFVTNKSQFANLTNIIVDDGGSYTELIPMSLPASLYPATPAVNDALYLGVNSSVVNAGPFDGLVFNLGTAATGTFTLEWEYYNGTTWTTLTVRDETSSFRQVGVKLVTWVRPGDWSETTVNSITGFFVRAKLDSVTAMTAPAQATDSIYAVTNPYIDIAAAQVTGDIQAVARILAHNRSDADGPGGSGPDLYANRLIVGLRSYSRGATFQAYLNVSDVQSVPGSSVAVGTNTSFADDPQAPTGRRATYAPSGVEAMATRITFSLGPSVARDFYGTYHAYLRGRRTAGSSTDITVRLQVTSGSGGITFTSQNQQFQTTTAFEVLDFGEITLPVSSSFKSTELGDVTEIRLQASAASGTPDLYLYDLILIPTDEWAGDFVDVANESDSEVGRSGGIAKRLDIDSITLPREDIRALTRVVGSDFITAEYRAGVNGPAVLQANARQRLWLLAMRTSATGTSYNWLAPPELVHSIQVYANYRYVGPRGAR